MPHLLINSPSISAVSTSIALTTAPPEGLAAMNTMGQSHVRQGIRFLTAPAGPAVAFLRRCDGKASPDRGRAGSFRRSRSNRNWSRRIHHPCQMGPPEVDPAVRTTVAGFLVGSWAVLFS